jgi:hypothetical protein
MCLPLIVRSNYSKVIDPIVVSGSPRSGTTWLAEILSAIPDSAIIWQPIQHRDTVPALKRLNLHLYEFIPEDASWRAAHETFHHLFEGKLLSPQLTKALSIKQLLTSNVYIFKFIRAGTFFPWLTNQCFFKTLPIYIVRHPCATIASQSMEKGEKIHPEQIRRAILDRQWLFPELIDTYRNQLKSLNCITEWRAALWCLENVLCLNHQDRNSRWITVMYEDLLLNRKRELNKIFQRLNRPVPETILAASEKMSSTARKGSPVLGHREQLTKWREVLNPSDVKKVVRILESFGIDLYKANPLPQRSFD